MNESQTSTPGSSLADAATINYEFAVDNPTQITTVIISGSGLNFTGTTGIFPCNTYRGSGTLQGDAMKINGETGVFEIANTAHTCVINFYMISRGTLLGTCTINSLNSQSYTVPGYPPMAEDR